MEQLEACRAHNPKVGSSNLPPATVSGVENNFIALGAGSPSSNLGDRTF